MCDISEVKVIMCFERVGVIKCIKGNEDREFVIGIANVEIVVDLYRRDFHGVER